MSKAAVKKAAGQRSDVQGNTPESTVEECIELLTKNLANLTKNFSDHETRIAKLEKASFVTTETVTKDTDSDTKEPAPQAQAAQAKSEPAAQVVPVAYSSCGPTMMYKWWDVRKKRWGYPKNDLFAAKQAGNGIWEPVWVWTVNGQIDHVLSDEEIEEYCP